MQPLSDITKLEFSLLGAERYAGLPRKTEKPWGHELLWAHADHYAAKILHIEAGQRLSLQFHREKEETLLLVQGQLRVELEGSDGCMGCYEALPGEIFHISPGKIHRMTALETCDVLEVSTPQLDDVIRLQDDFGRVHAELPMHSAIESVQD